MPYRHANGNFGDRLLPGLRSGNLPRVRTSDSPARPLTFSALALTRYNIGTLARRVLIFRTGEILRRHGTLDRPPDAFTSKSNEVLTMARLLLDFMPVLWTACRVVMS